MYPSDDSNSAQLYRRASRVMPDGNSRTTLYYPPYPVYVVEGRGSRAVDADGIERVDFINCFSASLHGHCHPAIVDAAQQQVAKLVSVGAPTDVEIELAEILVERLPSYEQVRFCGSGTEAVMHTIRAARAYTGKPRIVKIEGSYHGTYDAAEVSQNSSPANWGDLSAPATTATSAGTPEGVMNDVAVMPMNDVQTSLAILENHREELAAVLVDPLPSRMSYLAMTPEYLGALRQWCSAHDVVLIFDEVLCLRGGYRGMQGEVDVTPDLTATGKIVGGGFPIGVFGGRSDIMAVFDASAEGGAKVAHGGTHNAHPVSMAAGIASMKLWDEEAVAHINALGDRARAGLDAAIQAAGLPGTTLGHGSMIGWFFSDEPVRSYRDTQTIEQVEGVQRHLFDHWLNNGVLAPARGGLILSTVMTEAEIDHMVEQAAVALASV